MQDENGDNRIFFLIIGNLCNVLYIFICCYFLKINLFNFVILYISFETMACLLGGRVGRVLLLLLQKNRLSLICNVYLFLTGG